MISPLNGVGGSELPALASQKLQSHESSNDFKNLMLEAIEQVNQMQQSADHAVEQLATGEDVNMAEVFTAVQKADMSFRMMLQLRNKMMEAYQEIQNIRI